MSANTTQAGRPFRCFDRVRLLVDMHGVKAGAEGHVVDLYPPDACEVDFGLDEAGDIVFFGVDVVDLDLVRADES